MEFRDDRNCSYHGIHDTPWDNFCRQPSRSRLRSSSSKSGSGCPISGPLYLGLAFAGRGNRNSFIPYGSRKTWRQCRISMEDRYPVGSLGNPFPGLQEINCKYRQRRIILGKSRCLLLTADMVWRRTSRASHRLHVIAGCSIVLTAGRDFLLSGAAPGSELMLKVSSPMVSQALEDRPP